MEEHSTSFTEKFGLVTWNVTVSKDSVTVSAFGKSKTIPKVDIVEFGIAIDQPYKQTIPFIHNEQTISLGKGYFGFVITYRNRSGKLIAVNFTFDPSIPACREVVQTLLSDGDIPFKGVMRSHEIRLAMGVGKGDIAIAIGITIAVILLVWLKEILL